MIDVAALVLSCGLAIEPETIVTLDAIVRTESGGNPYAIGVNDGPRLKSQPRTREKAFSVARRLAALGRSFDAGLGQINVSNFRWLGLDVERVFDPCENLRATHRVLAEAYGRSVKRFEPGQPALRAALSAYNTGDFRRGIANGYVQKVAAQVVVPALQPIDQPATKEPPIKPKARSKSAKTEPGGPPFGASNPAAFGFSEPQASPTPAPSPHAQTHRTSERR